MLLISIKDKQKLSLLKNTKSTMILFHVPINATMFALGPLLYNDLSINSPARM